MTIRVAKVPGAKWRLVDWYIAHLPARRVYLEPYCGSAAVLFNKPRSPTEVVAATDEQLATVDLDLVDFLDWKRARCPKTAAASQEFAEHWRARQVAALAATMVDHLMNGGSANDQAEQLDMFQGAA